MKLLVKSSVKNLQGFRCGGALRHSPMCSLFIGQKYKFGGYYGTVIIIAVAFVYML